MIYQTRSGAEILQRFCICDDRWIVLCFHNPSYGVWNMDDQGFCSLGMFSPSLPDATRMYHDRITHAIQLMLGKTG